MTEPVKFAAFKPDVATRIFVLQKKSTDYGRAVSSNLLNR